MKLRFAVACALLLVTGLWAAMFAFNAWAQSRKVDPGPQNESAFFHGYQPGNVITQFCGPPGTCTWGSSNGANSDNHYVRHSLDFQADLAIQPNREAELVSALRDDIVRSLELSHARVISRRDELGGGYRYEYVNGNSVGSISVQAPEHPFIQRDKPLGQGWEDIRIKLNVAEKWNEWAFTAR
jgi:hypothetical protein